MIHHGSLGSQVPGLCFMYMLFSVEAYFHHRKKKNNYKKRKGNGNVFHNYLFYSVAKEKSELQDVNLEFREKNCEM